jgi:cysteine-S-conjugate beta-lyase
MGKYDFDKIYDRRGSGCAKYDMLEHFYGKADLLPLWVADMDFAVAPEISNALAERLAHPVFGYNFRMKSYYASIMNWALRRYDWQIKREWIISTPGVVTAINAAVLTLTSPGDGILVQTPVYDPFFEAVEKHGRRLLTNPLVLSGGRYEIDFADFEQKLLQSRMFILCSPHNPVGRVWTREELVQMGRLCKKHGVVVVSDEIHADIVFSGHRHFTFGSLEDFADFSIVCYSPSKSFNLAGLCTSAIVIPDERLRKTVDGYIWDMHLFLGNTFGITALEGAYTHGEAWLESLLQYLESNLDYLVKHFAERLPNFGLIKPEGTFLTWLDFRQTGLTDEEFFDRMVNGAGLALSMGKTYGNDGRGFVRINFGCPVSVLQDACDRLFNTFG